MQTDSSNEDMLGPLPWCSSCGSDQCWMNPYDCKACDKLRERKECTIALFGQDGVRPMREEDRNVLYDKLSRYRVNVERRDDRKVRVRKRRSDRIGGSDTGIALASQRLMTEQDVSTRQRSMPGAAVTSASKKMIQAATDNLTFEGQKALRTIDANTREGRK